MATSNTGFTKTGNGWLTRLANKAAYIPVIGGGIAAVIGVVDSSLEAVGWLLRGKPLSAATALTTGLVGSAVNAMNSGPTWWVGWGLNVVSGVTTGRSLATNARGLTEGVTSFVTKPLGIQPTVLRSYPAGIGGIGGATPSQPGRFASAESARRGQNAQSMYNNYMSGEGGVHVNQLGSANYAR